MKLTGELLTEVERKISEEGLSLGDAAKQMGIDGSALSRILGKKQRGVERKTASGILRFLGQEEPETVPEYQVSIKQIRETANYLDDNGVKFLEPDAFIALMKAMVRVGLIVGIVWIFVRFIF